MPKCTFITHEYDSVEVFTTDADPRLIEEYCWHIHPGILLAVGADMEVYGHRAEHISAERMRHEIRVMKQWRPRQRGRIAASDAPCGEV